MSLTYAFYADRLIHSPCEVYAAIRHDCRRAWAWCDRLHVTLTRSYYNGGGKVQIRHWNRALQYALYQTGWEVYARPIGSGSSARYQLVFAPASGPMAEAPVDLYAAV